MNPASRQASLAYRQSLPPQLHQELSRQLCSRLHEYFATFAQNDSLRKPLTVGAYRSLKGEPDLTDFFRSLMESPPLLPVRMAFPRVNNHEEMSFHAIESLENSETGDAVWETGQFGIQQPLASVTPVSPSELDWILVPGLIFSQGGARVGHGKGYYDRYLPHATRAVRTGIAFDAQIFEEVEQAPHDAVMHSVITQSRIILVPKEPG